ARAGASIRRSVYLCSCTGCARAVARQTRHRRRPEGYQAVRMPDVALKPQVYKDPRPKEYFDQFHERVRSQEPEWIYELVRTVTVWHALISFRARGLGAENVPNGPVILAP